MSTSCRLDRLLGRRVRAGNNRVLGRLEEFRAERRGSAWVVSEYVVGPVGLLERLGLGVRLLLGTGHGRSFLVRWDQMDLTDPERPRLSCPVADVRRM